MVELLVVLGIIGLILGMSVPALSGYSRQLRLKTATRELVGLLSLARSKAIGGHAEYAVVINPESRQVSVMDVASGETLEQMVRLPSSVTLDVQVGGESAPETQLVFRPTGSLSGRTTTLVLADHERQHTITVVGATGAISVD